jgi:hypothetical protein
LSVTQINPTFFFDSWSGDITSTDSTIELILDAATKTITATFTELPIAIPAVNLVSYVPSQTERADQLHQLQCLCLNAPIRPTDYSTRNRQIRSLATGCCFRWGVADITVTDGSNYSVGDFLQLDGGVTVAKPLLVRVTGVDVSGSITSVTISYAGQYYVRPFDDYTMTQLSGSGTGLLTVEIRWVEVCPCPWQYKRAV